MRPCIARSIRSGALDQQAWYGRWPHCRQGAFNNWNSMCEHCGAPHQQQFQQRPARSYAAAARKRPSFRPGDAFSREGGVELAEWFDAAPFDPIGVKKNCSNQGKVEVAERCCLDNLRKMEGNPCLIVMAKEGLPLKQNNGSGLQVFQGFSLCDIVEAAAGAEPSLPRHGGYYASSVRVHRLSDSTTVSSEASMVLMRTL